MQKLFCCIGIMLLTLIGYTQSSITWDYLDSIAEHKVQSFTYQQLKDTTLKVWYIPSQQETKEKKAAVIWIHGGAWVGGKANTFFANAAYCSLNNAVGISIEYRLLTKAEYDVSDCINDCSNAITAIKKKHKELNIDTNKIVLVGESAGGHLAAMVALRQTHQLKALILYNPVLNCHTGTFIKFMHTPLLINKQPIDTTSLLNTFKNKALSLSPLFLVKRKLPSTLILQGLDDKITPAQYAIAFKDSLQLKKTNCSLELLSNASHAFAIAHYKASEQQVINALNSLANFLQKQNIISLKVLLLNSYSTTWLNRKH